MKKTASWSFGLNITPPEVTRVLRPQGNNLGEASQLPVWESSLDLLGALPVMVNGGTRFEVFNLNRLKCVGIRLHPGKPIVSSKYQYINYCKRNYRGGIYGRRSESTMIRTSATANKNRSAWPEGEMMKLFDRHQGKRSFARFFMLVMACSGMAVALQAQDKDALALKINWDKTTVVSKSIPTLQVVVNPPLRPGQPLGVAAYKAVKELGADYVRYVPWLPYPKLAVAELEPPTPQKASWDFSQIDPMTKDFLNATEGHPTVVNFSTMPAWLFKTEKPIAYPADGNKVNWDYTQGTELRDPSGKEMGDYYGRLVSWYVNGGFSDENGVRHESGYHYNLPVWQVLNEPED